DGKHDLVRVGRLLRAEYDIPSGKLLDYIIRPNTPAIMERLKLDLVSVRDLLRAADVAIDPAFTPAHLMPSALSAVGTIYMPLKGAVDRDAELTRLRADLVKITSELEKANLKLADEQFLKRARPEVVDRQRSRQRELADRAERVKRLIRMVEEM
ncbi:MAG: hypothetical protein N2255_09850, partial [Kiritimatiellae bacterium]|nr:hypothetical protein [Kiritimatiellia bacterium]